MIPKKRTVFHIGTSLVLVTFILLCLAAFSVLSVVNANSDYQLSENYADYVSSYYKADEKAKEILNQIRQTLISEYQSQPTTLQENFFKSCTGILSQNPDFTVETEHDTPFISYSVDITDTQKLTVTLKLAYPADQTDSLYQIVSWASSPSTDWTPEENIPVFDGKFPHDN